MTSEERADDFFNGWKDWKLSDYTWKDILRESFDAHAKEARAEGYREGLERARRIAREKVSSGVLGFRNPSREDKASKQCANVIAKAIEAELEGEG